MPYKVFADGDTLTANEVMTYMMNQQVMVFADASARDAAIALPTHGMIAFLKDSSRLSYYNGTQWTLV